MKPLVVLAVPCLLLGASAQAGGISARGGHASVAAPAHRGPPVAAHEHAAARLQHTFEAHRAAKLAQRNTVWPAYPWWWAWPAPAIGAPPPETSLPAPAITQIDAGTNAPVAVAQGDFDYVQGCHAIPNGYHCDTNAGPAQ